MVEFWCWLNRVNIRYDFAARVPVANVVRSRQTTFRTRSYPIQLKHADSTRYARYRLCRI